MKKTYIFIGGGVVLLVVIAAIAFVVIHNPQKSTKNSTKKTVDSSQTSESGLSGSQASIDSDGSNGLNIVQTNPNNAQTGTDGSSSPTNGGGQKATQIDPSKFIDYEKYKDGQTALYADIQVGTGDTIQAGQTAAVYYKGWLTNGQLFDQTRTDASGKQNPYIFGYGAHQVIAGWEQGMAGMKVGGTRLLIIPPAAGYGANGQDPIPGNSVLVFEVQLLAVK